MLTSTPPTVPELEQLLYGLTNPDLKWYLAAVSPRAPGRKDALVAALRAALLTPSSLDALLAALSEPQRLALAAVVYRFDNRYDEDALEAKYGPGVIRREPRASYSYVSKDVDTTARPYDVFFYPWAITYGASEVYIPRDLAALLRARLPEPAPSVMQALDAPPEHTIGKQSFEVYVAETEPAAFHDLAATLDLIQRGKVAVSASTRLPTLPAVRALRERLLLDDYIPGEYTRSEEAIRPTGLLMLVQAAGWAEPAGKTRLVLTPLGADLAARGPDAPAIGEAWSRWLDTDLLDELSRARGIKGRQSSSTRLTPPPERRARLTTALAALPPGRWVTVAELLRYVRAENLLPAVEEGTRGLYFGYRGWDADPWQGTTADYIRLIVGSYVRAVVWEYAATLGLVDVAYVAPEDAYLDLGWMELDADYLSLFDGLLAVRLTPLGAHVLTSIGDYVAPEPAGTGPILRILPNFDVVLTDPAHVLPNDRATLERIAQRQSDHVYRLSREALLDAVETGFAVDQARAFLADRGAVPPDELPQTVQVLFADIERRLGLLRQSGPLVALEADDPLLIAELANTPGLRTVVEQAAIGDRAVLLVPQAAVAGVRRQLKKLGYLPRRETDDAG